MLFARLSIKSALLTFISVLIVCLNGVIFLTSPMAQKEHILKSNNYVPEIIDGKPYYVKDYSVLRDSVHRINYTSIKQLSETVGIQLNRTVIKVTCSRLDTVEHFYIRTDEVPVEFICDVCEREINPELITRFRSENINFIDNTDKMGAYEVSKILFGTICVIILVIYSGGFVLSFAYYIIKRKIYNNIKLFTGLQSFCVWVIVPVTLVNFIKYYIGF